jgi:hypothetical protein
LGPGAGCCSRTNIQEFKALFLKNLAVSLLKPDPNDRLFTAAVRYIEPIIDDHERDGIWERDLPQNNNILGNISISQARALRNYGSYLLNKGKYCLMSYQN